MATLLIALAVSLGLTGLLASLIAVAQRRLRVDEDPRIDAVEDMLPHANCGACGYPGCRPFAEALVAGVASPARCTVGNAEGHARIGQYLGVDVGAVDKRVARLACAGGDHVARTRARYVGTPTCAAAAAVAGGGKGCAWGCLGLGDCDRACSFDAIRMDGHGLPVVDEAACTACGDCVTACPKELFSIQVASHRLWVACKSEEEGDAVLTHCAVGCTACGRCAADAPGLIQMKRHLPVIDYARGGLSERPAARCPTGAIVWIDEKQGPQRGAGAAPVIRQAPLPPLPS